MKFLDEYRDGEAARSYAREIARITTRPWALMEICGGQTHAIVKFGIDELLPQSLSLIHGPGCPVCVTPLEIIDKALEIAARKDVIFTSFGDMLRVPGSHTDLLSVKAAGGRAENAVTLDRAARTRAPSVTCAGRSKTAQWRYSRTSPAG